MSQLWAIESREADRQMVTNFNMRNGMIIWFFRS